MNTTPTDEPSPLQLVDSSDSLSSISLPERAMDYPADGVAVVVDARRPCHQPGLTNHATALPLGTNGNASREISQCPLCDERPEDTRELVCTKCDRVYHYGCLSKTGYKPNRIPYRQQWQCWICCSWKKESYGIRKLLANRGFSIPPRKEPPKPKPTKRIKRSKPSSSAPNKAVKKARQTPKEVETLLADLPESQLEELANQHEPSLHETSSSESSQNLQAEVQSGSNKPEFRVSKRIPQPVKRQLSYKPPLSMISRADVQETMRSFEADVRHWIDDVDPQLKYPHETTLETLIQMNLFQESSSPYPEVPALVSATKKYLGLSEDKLLIDQHLSSAVRILKQSTIIKGLVAYIIWKHVFEYIPPRALKQEEIDESLKYDETGAQAFLHHRRCLDFYLYQENDSEVVNNIQYAATKLALHVILILYPLLDRSDPEPAEEAVSRIMEKAAVLTIRLKALPGNVEMIWAFPGDEFQWQLHKSTDGLTGKDISDLKKKGRATKVLVTIMPGIIYTKPDGERLIYAQASVKLYYHGEFVARS